MEMEGGNPHAIIREESVWSRLFQRDILIYEDWATHQQPWTYGANLVSSVFLSVFLAFGLLCSAMLLTRELALLLYI